MHRLSVSQLMAASAKRLQASNFHFVTDAEDEFGTSVRVFEGPLSIVGVAVFETWPQLETGWPAAQGRLVEIMSLNLVRAEPKAWEGYLVLLTSDDLLVDQLSLDRIRRDTSRLRKIVATGSDLGSLAAVDEVLLPILPIEFHSIHLETEGIINRLPMLLANHGIDEQLAVEVIEAYADHRSMVEAVWQWRRRR